MRYDTIIIGAGMSGLAAGIRLAYFERRVCVLERHTTIGGLNSFYRLRHRDYDVGLHAVTNYARRGQKQRPLAKLLRQLRLDWDDFDLRPQRGSAIDFPGVRLKFDNDFDLLLNEIAARFPRQIDRFRRLVAEIDAEDPFRFDQPQLSARAIVGRFLDDPLLIDMLLCPILYYCSATPGDVEWRLFVILFRSIFQEGFGRPFEGIRRILKTLVKQFRGVGGELRLRAGVRRILHEQGRVVGVELDDGTRLEADSVLSSAGLVETQRLSGNAVDAESADASGEISFLEAISTLDCPPAELGCSETAVFFCRETPFRYGRPDEPVDLASGIVCIPDNYEFDEPLAEHRVNVTALADHRYWTSLAEEEYRREKAVWCERMLANAADVVGDFRSRIVDQDVFTPRTIRHFTGHVNGAVYGATVKSLDGVTPIEKLYLIGTDQGLPGIVGAMLSGISMANVHLLRGDG